MVLALQRSKPTPMCYAPPIQSGLFWRDLATPFMRESFHYAWQPTWLAAQFVSPGRKLEPYVEEERRRSGSQKTFEWFQWLAIQLERHSPGKTNLQVGAQEAYRDWRP